MLDRTFWNILEGVQNSLELSRTFQPLRSRWKLLEKLLSWWKQLEKLPSWWKQLEKLPSWQKQLEKLPSWRTQLKKLPSWRKLVKKLPKLEYILESRLKSSSVSTTHLLELQLTSLVLFLYSSDQSSSCQFLLELLVSISSLYFCVHDSLYR